MEDEDESDAVEARSLSELLELDFFTLVTPFKGGRELLLARMLGLCFWDDCWVFGVVDCERGFGGAVAASPALFTLSLDEAAAVILLLLLLAAAFVILAGWFMVLGMFGLEADTLVLGRDSKGG